MTRGDYVEWPVEGGTSLGIFHANCKNDTSMVWGLSGFHIDRKNRKIMPEKTGVCFPKTSELKEVNEQIANKLLELLP